jgi:hypothetical protein
MPDPLYILSVDESHWPFGAAVVYVAYRDVAKVCAVKPILPYAGSNWPPEIRQAFRDLCRAIASETVGVTGAAPIFQWVKLQDMLSRVENPSPGQLMTFAMFVNHVQRVTYYARVHVADLRKAFPAPSDNPALAKAKRPPALSDMQSFCKNHAGVYKTAPLMDAAVREEFQGHLKPETLRKVRADAGFTPVKGRPKGSKNKLVKRSKRSKK